MNDNIKVKESIENILYEILMLPSGTEVSSQTKLREDLKTDDEDLMEIIMETESTFGIFIPDEKAKTLISVGDLVSYVKKELNLEEEK